MKLNIVISVISLLFVMSSSYGQQDSVQTKVTKKKLSFRDQEDGAFDVSQFLLEHNGVLPVIIPITEPAVGYGGGAALLYFHKKKKKYNSYVGPDVSGLVGLYTENKTWGAGAFHAHTFGENRLRTMTAIIKPDVKLKYYGNGSAILAKNPVGINLDSWLFYQKAQVRIGESKFYVGAAYMYFNAKVSFDTIPNRPLINLILRSLNTNSTVSTIKPIVTFDSRDNNFTPTKGLKAEVGLNYSAKWLGSSDNYSTLNTDLFYYLPINEKLHSKFRYQGSFMLGDAPFFAYPFIDLRGVAAMRYQNDITMVVETEWSYNVYKRWWVTGFGGTGKAFSSFDKFNEEKLVYNVGTGFRYRLARLLGMNMGTDFAWGNGKDFAFYIVFGTSW